MACRGASYGFESYLRSQYLPLWLTAFISDQHYAKFCSLAA
uniref:Uncharacterized protein n=1 Tax=Arundo donax TaxID=35708 RepID=A0A0A8Y8C1_ARUDO